MKRKLELLKMTDDQLDAAVKIQGTKYDRKRKLSESTLKRIVSLASKNTTYSEIAKKLGLNYSIVKYHADPVWRAEYNAKRDGRHTGKDHISIKNRVAYKRGLVAAGKLGA